MLKTHVNESGRIIRYPSHLGGKMKHETKNSRHDASEALTVREAKRSIVMAIGRALEDMQEEFLTAEKEEWNVRNKALMRISVSISECLRGNGECPSKILNIIDDLLLLHMHEIRELAADANRNWGWSQHDMARSNHRLRHDGLQWKIINLIEMSRGLEPCLEVVHKQWKDAEENKNAEKSCISAEMP